MEANALIVAGILLDGMPDYISEETVSEKTGLAGYAVRWYVFQLRRAGYVIEAVQYAEPARFAAGVRGWRLTDILSTPYVPARGQEDDVADAAAPDLMNDVAALAALIGKARRAAKRGRRVRVA